jgi:hypothetical protein
MEELEDELRQIHGEDGLEEAGLKFDQDSSTDVTPDEGSEMMQETAAANQIIGRDKEDLFTYEVCPLNVIFLHVGDLMTLPMSGLG